MTNVEEVANADFRNDKLILQDSTNQLTASQCIENENEQPKVSRQSSNLKHSEFEHDLSKKSLLRNNEASALDD